MQQQQSHPAAGKGGGRCRSQTSPRSTYFLLVTMCAMMLILSSSLVAVGVDAVAGVTYEPGTPVPGKVVQLTQVNFQHAIKDSSNPLWLLKFYAPWCGHCKKLAPVLEDVATQTQNMMAIGTIDCTVEKKLCNDHGVRGYPTLKFSLDGIIHDYPGGRHNSDFTQFAHKLSRFAIEECKTVEELQQILDNSEDGVAFVAYHPMASSSEEENSDTNIPLKEKLQRSLLTQVFTQVARKEIAYGTFAMTNKAVAEKFFGKHEPFVCRVENNVATRCYRSSKDDVELDDLLQFVHENNIPTVAKLGANNFHKVGRRGKPLVIGVIDGDHKEQVQAAKRELSHYALEGPEVIRKQYYYGYIDGKVFQRFLAQFDVLPDDLPQLLVLDVPTRTYWQNSTYRLNVDDFVSAIASKTFRSKNADKQGLEGVMKKLYYAVVEYRPWSVIFIVLVVFAIGVVILSLVFPGDELRPPYPPHPSTTATPSTNNNATTTHSIGEPAAAKTDDKNNNATAADDSEPKKTK